MSAGARNILEETAFLNRMLSADERIEYSDPEKEKRYQEYKAHEAHRRLLAKQSIRTGALLNFKKTMKELRRAGLA